MQPHQIKKNRQLSTLGILIVGACVTSALLLGHNFLYKPYERKKRRKEMEEFTDDYFRVNYGQEPIQSDKKHY